MKKIFLLAAYSLFGFCMAAQNMQEIQRNNNRRMKDIDSSGWKKTGFFIFNLNQASLSDWSSGGEKFLIGINGILNYAIHHKKGKFSQDTYFDLELGTVEAASFKKFRKTTDRCDITTELDHKTGTKNLYYGLLFNLNTQFLPGHNYSLAAHDKISNFLTPGKIFISPGLDYKMKGKASYFSVFISPATAKFVTKVDDDFLNNRKFGVDSAQRMNTEFGAYITSHYNVKLSKTTRYIGRLDLYSNYFHHPENIDILLNNLFTFAISNLFAGNILIDVIYDHDTKRRTQVQEIFGLGLKLKL